MAGRKLKQGVRRSSSGRIAVGQRGEREDQIIATVLSSRIRSGVRPDQARDQRAGYALGRLNLSGELTSVQFEAGRRYASTVGRYAKTMGFPRPTPPAAVVGMVGGGESCAPEPDQEVVDRIKRDYNDAFGAMRDLEIQLGQRGPLLALNAVCIHDVDVSRDNARIGDLRSALNILAKMWGMYR